MTLTSVLRARDGDADAESRQSVTKILLQEISPSSAGVRTKSSLLALGQFLGKDIVSLRDVIDSLGNLPSQTDFGNPTNVQDVLYVLLQALSSGDLGSIVSQVVSVVLDKAAEEDTRTDQPDTEVVTVTQRQALWVSPLEQLVAADVVPIDDLRHHVFPTLFKRNLQDYVNFLEQLGLRSLEASTSVSASQDARSGPSRSELLYAALEVGKALGLVRETSDSHISRTRDALLLPVSWIDNLLIAASRAARLAGLSLLITSHSATRPFPASALRLLKRRLHVFFADTDASFRGDVYTLMQRLMDRMRSVTAVVARTSSQHGKVDPEMALQALKTLALHRSFLKWLLKFLGSGLSPSANYQCHISALKVLLIVSRSGLDSSVASEHLSKSALGATWWPVHLEIATPGLLRLLLDLLMDPFEDVRQTAATILGTLNDSCLQARKGIRDQLVKALQRAEASMLATGRADHADGVALLYALIYKQTDPSETSSQRSWPSQAALMSDLVGKLENMLTIAKSELDSAVDKYQMHGILTSIRYVLAQSKHHKDTESSLTRLVACLHEVWVVVRPVLCNDAPEGYAPEESGETPEVSTKDILSYCWRALKESSLLLETLISDNTTEQATLLSLGDLCFIQLAELRHRGAFSTVAQTWLACCSRCSALRVDGGKLAVKTWYTKILNMLSNKATINTRRSAGLPALVCGLLASDKSGNLLASAFEDLSAIAATPLQGITETDSSSLPQVHALNCIKDVLKSTRLREHSERYIQPSLQLAASSLRSQAWAIRNCGLMLFRAVIDRLLGTSDAHLTDTVSTARHTKLALGNDVVETILELLPTDIESTASVEGVFPALQLLQRVSMPEDKRFRALGRVLKLTGSTSWLIRDKAAMTHAALVGRKDTSGELRQRLGISMVNQNAAHGALLCVRYLILELRGSSRSEIRSDVRVGGDTTSQTSLLRDVVAAITSDTHFYYDNNCAVTQAAHVDLIAETLRCLHSYRGDGEDLSAAIEGLLSSLDVCKELEKSINASASVAGSHILRDSLAQTLAAMMCARPDSVCSEGVRSIISSLATMDPNACKAFFDSLRPGEESPIVPEKLTVAVIEATSEILKGNCDAGLKCEVQRYLLNFYNSVTQHESTSGLLPALLTACKMQSSPFSKHSNQQYADQWLEMQVVAHEVQLQLQQSRNTVSQLPVASRAAWISHWCRAVKGSGLFGREAAAVAISRAKLLWADIRDGNPPQFCKLCFGVYDLLNDDDEEIRLLAAESTARVLGSATPSSTTNVWEPSIASQKLAGFILQTWGSKEDFIAEAISRAFGIKPQGDTPSVAEKLSALQEIDTALFAEEKQNLFINDAREAKLWSQILLHIDASAIPSKLLRRITGWVSEGLATLVRNAREELHGALGWSTNPEVYVLGLRVLLGLEVLLTWAKVGRRLSVRPSELRAELGVLLALGSADDGGGLNVLWVREMERIFECGVVGVVLSAAASHVKRLVDNAMK